MCPFETVTFQCYSSRDLVHLELATDLLGLVGNNVAVEHERQHISKIVETWLCSAVRVCLSERTCRRWLDRYECA